MPNATTGGISWAQLVDKGVEGWLSYLNRPRTTSAGVMSPYGPSSVDTQLAVANAQLAGQQQTQKMLMLAAGALLAFYLLSK